MIEVIELLSKEMDKYFWIAPFIAFLAGALSSLMPCSLSTLPLIIGYVGGTGVKDTKRAFLLSLTYAGGMAATFTVLGTIAAIMGTLLGNFSRVWFLLLGILMILMALQTWEVIHFIPATNLVTKNTKKGFAGAGVAGILAGIFSSPCSTPVLIALLAIIAGKGNLIWGITLMLFYAIGHGVLSVLAGTGIHVLKNLSQKKSYGKISNIIKYVMGSCLLLIGLYMLYLAF